MHPHAQAVVLLDLMQPGGEPLIGGHSGFSTEWNRVCFSSVFWGSSAYVFLCIFCALVQVSLPHSLLESFSHVVSCAH